MGCDDGLRQPEQHLNLCRSHVEGESVLGCCTGCSCRVSDTQATHTMFVLCHTALRLSGSSVLWPPGCCWLESCGQTPFPWFVAQHGLMCAGAAVLLGSTPRCAACDSTDSGAYDLCMACSCMRVHPQRSYSKPHRLQWSTHILFSRVCPVVSSIRVFLGLNPAAAQHMCVHQGVSLQCLVVWMAVLRSPWRVAATQRTQRLVLNW